jgi:glycosyltransferase involved in cell wall biosynthesis
MSDLSNVSVVIPSFNENHSNLWKLTNELFFLGAEIIVVDDGSDNPFPTAIQHETNQGYGQSLMTGISAATRSLIITMDGDGQHRTQDALNLYQVWKMLDVDMVIGARRLDYEKPLRMWGRKCLNLIASFFTGRFLPDLNSGMRIFRRDIAKGYFPILCKTFSFTTSITMSFFCDNYKVEWFPIKVASRPHGKSHVKVIKDGLVTLKYILWIGMALRTRRIRAWLRGH